uniref:Hypothetical secreted protein 204 n=1 Tax=Amblyomma variegatum TaxID=34610 RepID=F0JA09_AMBVA|nr:TPA_inf: hypothetical secreted protein 204 [Amblyomma variegatum]
MNCLRIGLLFMAIFLAEAQRTATRNQCSYIERRSTWPRYDQFCKPNLTPRWELYKPRLCLCKQGYIRNSWGHCIKRQECNSCRHVRKKDFKQCSSACPLVCGKRVPQVCTEQCVVGCACPPGYVIHPSNQKSCVPVSHCPPRCPRHSTFQLCSSTCAPSCDSPRPKRCEIRCHEGECVCHPWFATALVKGDQKCVPRNRCPTRGE